MLGQSGATAYGGTTSRLGADVALPVTPTASLVATIHPDFSNVEADQQTIAPTTFTRFFPELRPFFAQSAKFYDLTNCYGCSSNWSELYTPAIPTPRSGYQLEGTQGPFSFGGLDAVGVGRDDNAQSVAWTNRPNTITLNATRIASEQTALTDRVDFESFQRVRGEPVLHPDNTQGARIDYLLNTPQQSTFNALGGSYGTGRLNAGDRLGAIRIARRTTLALEAYDTRWTGNGVVDEQWLERATLTFDIDRRTNAVVGLRRIVGTPPPDPGLPLPAFLNTTNISFGFTRHLPHDDLFVAYGDRPR